MSLTAPNARTPAILLTNDDGLDPSHALVLPLARELTRAGHAVVVVAPARDNSACSQSITLARPLTMHRHPVHERTFRAPDGAPLAVFSLADGTPADCVIAAAEPTTGLLARLGFAPHLCVSGVNMGQNLGNDVLYSGTFAAARQAAMYGLPAMAASVDLFRATEGSLDDRIACDRAVEAAALLALRAIHALDGAEIDPGRLRLAPGDVGAGGEAAVKEAFAKGDVVLNVNVPKEWDGRFATTRLDAVLHRGAVDLPRIPTEDEAVEFCIGKTDAYACNFLRAHGSDAVATLERMSVSVSPVSTWPHPHPLALPPALLNGVVRDGLMSWLAVADRVGLMQKT